MDPLSLKEKGNLLYRKRCFDAALVQYRKAAALAPDDPVYRSNEAACLYELGHYSECADVSQTVVKMIEAGQSCNEGFAEKNKKRCALALIFIGRQEEALSMLKEGLLSMDDEINLLIRNNFSSVDPSTAANFRLGLINQPFYRPARTSCMEHYVASSDQASSLLAAFPLEQDGGDGNTRPTMRETADLDAGDPRSMLGLIEDPPGGVALPVPRGTDPPLHLLIAGCGDCRTLLATAWDAHAQTLRLPPADRPRAPRVHILANDVHPCAIAKLVLNLALLAELAAFEAEEDLHARPAAALAAAALMYGFAAPVCPRCVAGKLAGEMDRLRGLSAAEVSRDLVDIDARAWEEVRLRERDGEISGKGLVRPPF
jgi:tetratricopeptide (TPR) repeat protein